MSQETCVDLALVKPLGAQITNPLCDLGKYSICGAHAAPSAMVSQAPCNQLCVKVPWLHEDTPTPVTKHILPIAGEKCESHTKRTNANPLKML